MSCKYQFYDENEKFYPHLYCKLRDGGYCLYSKRCDMVERFIPLEENKWKECGLYIMEQQKDIPKGSYFVQTNRKGKDGFLYLYVVIEDRIEKIKTNFEEINQCYVYLKEGLEDYQVSLTPFVEKKTVRKTKSESK